MLAGLILLFLVLALAGYLVGVYNGLVRVRAAVKLAWSNIDVLLAQRHDELPKLVEVCKQYMQYEGSTLERDACPSGVDAARSAGNMSGLGAAEQELRSGLSGRTPWRRTTRSSRRASRSGTCRTASAG